MDYLVHVLTLIGIYMMLSISLNLVAGYAGLLSMAHAAFYGIGAYVTALMALNLHAPFALSIVCAAVIGGVAGVVVAAPSARVRGDYFAVATFAFQVIVYSVLNNWVSFTGGPMGLPGIPRPVVFGLAVSPGGGFLLLTACLCCSTLWIARRLVRSPFGRVLKALREDEVFAQGAGKNVAAYKVAILAIGAGMAAVAGCTYAHYITFIDPTSFTVMESILVVAVVIIGGAGSLWGSVIGAVLLIALPELLRLVGLPNASAANLREVLYGGLLVALLVWRPRGMVGEHIRERG